MTVEEQRQALQRFVQRVEYHRNDEAEIYIFGYSRTAELYCAEKSPAIAKGMPSLSARPMAGSQKL